MKKPKKKCYKCGETKSSKFSPSVKNMCRDCNNEYQKRRREEKKWIQDTRYPEPDVVEQEPVLTPVSAVEYESREETFISKLKKERDELEDRIIKIDILIDTYSK